MKKALLLTVIILVFCIAAEGCSGFPSAGRDPQESTSETAIESAEFEMLPEKDQAELLEERVALEAQRKEQLGAFYVPLPELGRETDLKTVKAKALYLTANVSGFNFNEDDIHYYADCIDSMAKGSPKPEDPDRLAEINKLEKALAICESTEVNALVIDIKNDDGLVAWKSDIEIVNQIGSNWSSPLKDYEKLIEYLKSQDIYCIARIVAFKDPYFARAMNGHAIQLLNGGVYKDDAGIAWVNPFDKYVWQYIVSISQEAALRGFDEIQYDYVRFPDHAADYNPITQFPGRDGRDKDEAIEEFLEYANSELLPYNVHISADVFGVATRSWDDKPEDIGQTWRKIANQSDYICPMIYPSHYGPGIYGYAVPDRQPYHVSRLALMEAIERNAAQRHPGIIRPWFQGFTANWIKGSIPYDAKAISDQIVAAMELGIDEYIIWNASNNYEPMTFFYHGRIDPNTRKPGEDILARSPAAAVKRYLDAEKGGKFSHLYLLTPISERHEDYDAFIAQRKTSLEILKNYEIINVVKDEGETYTAIVSGEYHSTAGTAIIHEAKYKIVPENNIYKIIKPELTWIP